MKDRALQLVLTFGIALLAVPALAQTTEESIANSTPTPAWVRATTAGGTGSTVANAIKVAPNSDQYVTGQFSLKAKFSTTTLVAQGGTDIFLAKYEVSGKLLWVLQAGGGAEEDAGQALSLDSEGNVYVTGSFTNKATFNSTDHKSKSVSGNGQTTFLAKYTSAGHLVWIQTGVSSSAGLNCGTGLAINSSADSVYLSLQAQANTTFSSENGTSSTVSGTGTWHTLLAKYNTAGDFQWAQPNQASPNSLPQGVAVDADDNAYVTGWMENETTFFSANGNNITVTGFSPGQSNTDYPGDAFIAKYNNKGDVQWVNHIGGYKAIGTSVAALPNGEVSVTGFIGNVDDDGTSEAETIVTSQAPGANIDLGGGYFTDPYTSDVFAATFTSAGVLQRAFRYGSSQEETGNSVRYDEAGSLFIAGLSRPYTGISIGQAGPSPTLFVRKYSNGKLIWQQNAEDIGIWETQGTSPSLGLDPAGDVFVSGGYSGTAHFGAFPLKGSGSSDMFLAELLHK